MSFRTSIKWLPAIALAAMSLGTVMAQRGTKTEEPLPDALIPDAPAGNLAPLPELEPPVPAAGRGKADDTASLSNRLVALGEALAASNTELAALREQHSQLKLQMEALGVAALKGDERSLQQRLLTATADFKASETARTDITDKASRLAEAASAFAAKPGDAAVKASLEEAIKAVTAARPRPPEIVSLDAARVVSYKKELGLAVINAGRQSGIRMGTPMNILRADRTIGHGLVVDVRDRIAGILLTGSTPATVQAGDSAKPEIEKTKPSPK